MNTLHSTRLASQIFSRINASSCLIPLHPCSVFSANSVSVAPSPVFSEATIKAYRASTLALYQFYLGTYTSLDQLNLKHPEFWKGREHALSRLTTIKGHIADWWDKIFNPFNNLPLRLCDRGKTDILSQMDVVDGDFEIVLTSPTEDHIKNLKANLKVLSLELSKDSREAANLLKKLQDSRKYFVDDVAVLKKISETDFDVSEQYEKKITDLQNAIDEQNRQIAIGIGTTVVGGIFILAGVIGAFFSGGASLVLLVPGAGITAAGAIVIAFAKREKKILEDLKSDYFSDKTAIATLAGRLKTICDEEAGSLTKDFETVITPWSLMDSYLKAAIKEIDELKDNNDPGKWEELQTTFGFVKTEWMKYLEELPKLHYDVSVASVTIDPLMTEAQIEKILSDAKIISLSEWSAA